MKKAYGMLLLFLCCVCGAFSAGCGKKEEGIHIQQGQGGMMEYKDVQAEAEAVFDGAGHVKGVQFYKGEAVLVCTEHDDNGMTVISLCKEDGSKEVLLEGVQEEYFFWNFFLDAEGNLYCWSNGLDNGEFAKIDRSGKLVYSMPLKDMGMLAPEDICQLADGRVLITYLEGGGGSYYTLSEVDPAMGKVSKVSTVKLDGFGRVAAGESGLLYMDEGGVYEIGMENGSKTSILSFTGTSYMLRNIGDVEDFRVLEDGSVEILRYERNYETGETTYFSEVLQANTETTEKQVLTLRCHGLSNNGYGVRRWLKNQMAVFNQQSSSLMVVLDECPDGTEREDFARQTSIEITAGKGPDLIFGCVLGDYTYGAIRKGALVNLVPYMDTSGIKEENYFPAAFECWKVDGGVYGVSLNMDLKGYRIVQEVLGDGSTADIETLVDALLAWQGDAVLRHEESEWVLEYLLQGSEDLWGMVDWESGICDFSGDLFAKILEVYKRYGNSERRSGYPVLLEPRATSYVLSFDSATDREAEGMADVGVLFDDGGHPVIMNSLNSYNGYTNTMLAVNSNSANIDGAWEFVCFLLGETAQSSLTGSLPVKRTAFEAYLEKQVAEIIEEKRTEYGLITGNDNGEIQKKYPRSYKDLTEEKLTEYKEYVQSARPVPIRIAPLLDIIYEEAEYYFNGSKSIGEVSAIIQNRVQLYMNENS